MPISLPLYFYKWFQEKSQAKFEQTNRILATDDIEKFFKEYSAQKTISVFKSAVVDHDLVDGVPYYLAPPLPPLFYHDAFKRCLIAETLGMYADALNIDQAKDAVETLDTLCDGTSAGFVQIFAWQSLGLWARLKPEIFHTHKEQLLNAFGGSTASLLGAFLFLDQMCQADCKQQALDIIDQGKDRVKYKVQKALLCCKLTQFQLANSFVGKCISTDKNLQEFLERCQNQEYLYANHFREGLREVGLVPRTQKAQLDAGTQQADISFRLKKFCSNDVSVVGMYLNVYWN